MSSENDSKVYKLGDLGQFKNGANFSQENYGPGYRLVNVKQLYSGRYIQLEGLESLSKDVLKRPEQLFLEKGDILFARSSVKRSGAGQCALVPDIDEPIVFSGFIIRYRLRDKIHTNPMFLTYLLQSPIYREIFPRIATGTTISNLSQDALKQVEIRLPTTSIQNASAKLLGTLDDRIALLRETNKTLESIAQAIFKSWFVDFDPVRAKMEGHQPEGMDEATAALFPDSFEESELGLIPKGWSAGSLNDLSDLNPESWSKKNHPHKLRYVDLANTKSNVISEMPELLFSEAPSRARRVLRGGDTIIGTVRPGNKSFAFVHTALENMTGSTGFAVLRPKFPEATEFIYLAATQESSIEYLTHIADGAAYPAVRPEVVADMSSVMPSDEILRKFHTIASVFFASVANNQSKADTLTSLRDTLLPRLISGQLRLPEAQAIVEEHSL